MVTASKTEYLATTIHIWTFLSEKVSSCNKFFMRKAIGILIVLWGLSHFFSTAFSAFEDAAIESFQTVSVAAALAQYKLGQID